jgi:hypothetical protein
MRKISASSTIKRRHVSSGTDPARPDPAAGKRYEIGEEADFHAGERFREIE